MENIKEVLLIETVDEFIYMTVTEILEDNKIPYYAEDDYSGGYMKLIGGISLYNKKIYVSNMDYKKAYNLIENFIKKD